MSAHPGRSRDPCRDADGIESREFAPLLPLPRRASWSVSTRAVGASTMAAQLLRLDSIDRWLDRERQDALAGSNDENSAPLTPSHTLGRVAGKQRSFEVTTPASTSTPARGRPSALSRADSVASCETDATEIVAEPACADAIEDVAPVVVELSRRKPCVPLLALFADRSGPLRYTSLQPLCSRWPSARFLAICLHPALGSSCPSPRSSSPPFSRPPDRSWLARMIARMPCTSNMHCTAHGRFAQRLSDHWRPPTLMPSNCEDVCSASTSSLHMQITLALPRAIRLTRRALDRSFARARSRIGIARHRSVALSGATRRRSAVNSLVSLPDGVMGLLGGGLSRSTAKEVAIFAITNVALLYALKYAISTMDPARAGRSDKERKSKAVLGRLGVRDVQLSEHEVCRCPASSIAESYRPPSLQRSCIPTTLMSSLTMSAGSSRSSTRSKRR